MYKSIHAYEKIVYICSVCFQPYGKLENAFECCKCKKTTTNKDVKPILENLTKHNSSSKKDCFKEQVANLVFDANIDDIDIVKNIRRLIRSPS